MTLEHAIEYAQNRVRELRKWKRERLHETSIPGIFIPWRSINQDQLDLLLEGLRRNGVKNP